ncbi:MAG TPA: ABC transporter permease [Opitutaceae bacterium]|nr:ABC transporter permease [Opitutaceae bacterium]
MKPLRQLLHLFRRRKLERDMTDEMRHHLEEQTRRNVRAGMPADEAAYAAHRKFGNVASLQERVRTERGWAWLDHGSRDVRFSWRALRRSRGFSLAVVVTLALCIGANTTILSVLYGLVLKPLPFPDPGQLVQVYNSLPKGDRPKERASIAQYLDYQANADRFAGFALWTVWTFNIGEDADPERGIGARVTADYFKILGVEPVLGRFYTAEECVPGKDFVLVLTETFWERKFKADPGVIGREIRLGGQPFTIIGVAPRRLEALNADATVLKPFEWQPQQANPQARFSQNGILYARMKPGVGPEEARAQLITLEQRWQEQVAPPATREFLARGGFTVGVGRIRAEQTRSVRTSLLLLQGGACFVLLLGCVNVANLMLARANARRTELAVRQALGAGPGALARQMIVEGLLLALAGAGGGLALAWGSLRVINTYTTAIVREVAPVAIDGTVLGLTLLTAVAVALLIALLPVMRAWRTNLLASLQSGSRGSSAGGGSRAAGGVLVMAQVGLALVLLVGAGLLLRSFARVLQVDPGFDASRAVQGRTVFGYPGQTPESIKSTQDLIIARMREIPGVEQVGYTNVFPLSATLNVSNFPIRGSSAGPGESAPTASLQWVSPGYLEAMGIKLIEGRYFNETDATGPARRVFIVDANFARKHFPGRSAVGETFAFRHSGLPADEWPRIIGVVAPAKLSGLEDRSGTPFVFTPMGASAGFSMVLRTSRPAREIVPLMRQKLRSVDPGAPLYHEGSLQEELEFMLSNRRGVMWLLGAFAGVALLLSAVGLYGMLAYDVAQRTKEIGIRGAVGATRGQIAAMILRQGLGKAGLGLALGLAGAFHLSRYLASLLFEIDPTDPLVFASVPLLLLLVTVLASWLPARRAARVDPLVALRSE